MRHLPLAVMSTVPSPVASTWFGHYFEAHMEMVMDLNLTLTLFGGLHGLLRDTAGA